ncbi:MAG: L-threonylcarbamoyladenylate synthase [Chlamydiales bacterium]
MLISFEEAVKRIDNDQVIATVTDTVFGLACSYQSEKGAKKIFDLKHRDLSMALPILFSQVDSLKELCAKFPPGFEELANAFWPGGLTLIIEASLHIPSIVRAGKSTIGLRQPDHTELLKLLDAVGPLASTSANLSGTPPAEEVNMIEKTFGADFPVYHEGKMPKNTPSTVLEFTQNYWHVRREGAISENQIKKVITNLAG